MQIRVRKAKGNKDRYTLLSQNNLSLLRKYWKEYQPEYWLFPGMVIYVFPITPAEIVIVLNARDFLRKNGLRIEKKDLLPVQYYHIVFTMPNNLNDLVLRNKRQMYSLLFKASSETLKELAADPKYLGANIGFISILHTWGQNLMDHPSFANPAAVIEYLGRYTNKVAISNHRIINMEDGKVTFRYKDYSDDGKNKFMSLDVFEFIRRFLLHVLPKRFVRIRYYDLLCNRYRKQNLVFCRYLLQVDVNTVNNSPSKESWQDILFRLTGKDLSICPECGGNMVSADDLYFIRPSPA